MKFGKLLRATVEARMPQWRDFIVDYKALKQALNREVASKGGLITRRPLSVGLIKRFFRAGSPCTPRPALTWASLARAQVESHPRS